MSHRTSENPHISTENFPEPLFDLERDFVPTTVQIDGPVTSFSFGNKEKVLEKAVETGQIASNFQDCGPFSDAQQKAVRQEAITLRGISDIFDDTLSGPLEDLTPEQLSMRFYADRVISEAVLVEASRKAFLEQGSRNEVFYRRMIQESQEALYPAIDRELALDALGLFNSRGGKILESGVPASGFVQGLFEKYPFLNEAHGRKPQALKPEVEAKIKSILISRYGETFQNLREEFGEISNSSLVEVTQRLFGLLGFTELGWKVEDATSSRTGFAVIPQTQTFQVGKRSKEITWDAYEGLMVHECSHVRRSANAIAAGQKPLGIGWQGYESPEEGLTMLQEKSWTGTASKATTITRDHYRYALAAYATGVLDGRRHGIQDCYDFAVNLKLIGSVSTKVKKGEHVNLDALEKDARKQMGEHVFRLFRGMPDGIALIKDIVYLDGYTKEVARFNSSEDIEGDLNRSMRGKYNDLDELQVETVDQLYGQ